MVQRGYPGPAEDSSKQVNLTPLLADTSLSPTHKVERPQPIWRHVIEKGRPEAELRSAGAVHGHEALEE